MSNDMMKALEGVIGYPSLSAINDFQAVEHTDCQISVHTLFYLEFVDSRLKKVL